MTRFSPGVIPVVLATDGATFEECEHAWHMGVSDRMVAADGDLFRATRRAWRGARSDCAAPSGAPSRVSAAIDGIAYHMEVAMLESLVEQMLADALEAERLRVEVRTKLVGAVRRGAAAGMSQREIARAVNRS